ncbi:MAG: hypothetical protein ABIP94_13080, partial [Planctomycetota bacterium]
AGSAVAASVWCSLGSVVATDGGIHAAAFLPDGDILLTTGHIVSGSLANQPIVRWTPPNGSNGPNGVLAPVPVPNPYSSPGNYCNALVVSEHGGFAFAECQSSVLGGSNVVFDVLAIPLNGGPAVVLPDNLATGEFVTQLFWDCNGDLLGAASRVPLGSGGRVLRWRQQAGVWVQIGSTAWPGLITINAGRLCWTRLGSGRPICSSSRSDERALAFRRRAYGSVHRRRAPRRDEQRGRHGSRLAAGRSGRAGARTVRPATAEPAT